MNSTYPYLEVCTPDRVKETIWFKELLAGDKDKHRIAIGRLEDNDIVLPDPQKKISRYHCAIAWEAGRWWAIDEGSANGTFLRRTQAGTEIDVRCDGKVFLQDGDVILILGKLVADNEPVFWELTFRDPAETESVELFQPPAEIAYSLSQQRLFRIVRHRRDEIVLSRQESLLIHYMAQRKWDNNNRSVVCSHEELIEAIWGDSFGHINNEITRLVWGIRNKIELDSGEPKFLQTVRGQGYRLEIEILS